PARPDRAAILGLQPGICPGSERARLECRLDRYHDWRDGAAGRRGEGLQADRGDLREIPDRIGMRPRESNMTILSRRSVLRNSLVVAAAGTLARPYVANAAAATAEVWWAQGFVQEE